MGNTVSDLGQQLKQAREARGLTLYQAEEATHIRRVFLEALEEGRFADLPGGVYARGFVKSYANYLGLDGQELVRLYRETAGSAPMALPPILNEPLFHRPRAGRLVWVAVIVGLMAVLGWFLYDQLAPTIGSMTFWPPDLSFLRPATLPQPSPTAAPTATPTVVPSPTATLDVTEPTAPPIPTNTVAALTVATATLQPPTPTVSAPITKEAIVVEVNVSAPTYLEVRLDGVADYVGILQRGESRTWTADARVELRVGNAGGVTLRVNDVPVPSLGQTGQVVDVVYTPDTLPTP